MANADSIFQRALSSILTEIFDGPPGDAAYLLNPGDPGLLKQLRSIDAKKASSRPMPGQTTIAAHVDHLLFGFTLFNRWVAGEENPWADADWGASWKRGTVTDEQWRALCDKFEHEVKAWQKAVAAGGRAGTEWSDLTASGAISSAAHTTYHFGAIRQILAAMGK